MLVSSNVTMQFGSKPLFENISVKFGGGNRYGLIGANGSGKSTFMKILGGDLEPTLGNVSLDPNERIGKLRQDQFAFEAPPAPAAGPLRSILRPASPDSVFLAVAMGSLRKDRSGRGRGLTGVQGSAMSAPAMHEPNAPVVGI